MVTQATITNLRRKHRLVDMVNDEFGYPMFTWLELSISDLCNRQCVFCPHSSEAEYPNQPLHMSLHLAEIIHSQLRAINYKGTVNLCGYGEPLLHPLLVDLVTILSDGEWRVELTTNGDRLDEILVRELRGAGLRHLVVSMYDGPEQVKHFQSIFNQANATSAFYSLRDRWMGAEDDYGLILTNRAGIVHAGNQAPVDKHRACFYLTYSMMVDWNGDVLLCSQDWVKRVKFGNLNHDTLLGVWLGPPMMKRRRQLLHGRAGLSPCEGCNVDGQLHGLEHVAAWSGGNPPKRAVG